MLEGKNCAKCGREFFPTPEHVYTAGKSPRKKYYCSWTCFNHRNERAKTKGYRCKAVGQYTLDGVFIRRFDSANKAAEFMGIAPETVRNACRGKVKKPKFIWKYID